MAGSTRRQVSATVATAGFAAVMALIIAAHQPQVSATDSWWRLCMGFASAAFAVGIGLLFVRSGAKIKGEIETAEHHGISKTGEISFVSEARLYVRIVNTGDPSSLLRWEVTAKDVYRNEIRVLQLFSPSVMGAGEAFRSMEDLKSSKFETGACAVVPIGIRTDTSAKSIDPSSIRVSFEDAWRKKFIIGPAKGLSVTIVGLSLGD